MRLPGTTGYHLYLLWHDLIISLVGCVIANDFCYTSSRRSKDLVFCAEIPVILVYE